MVRLYIQPSEIGEFTLSDFLDHQDRLDELNKWEEEARVRAKRGY